MSRPNTLSLLLVAGACSVLFPAAGEARPGTDGVIKVCSQYGKGCVTAPTRPGRFNDRDVRLPGGTWIACKLDCRQTLREESVDFFETLRERAPGNNRR